MAKYRKTLVNKICDMLSTDDYTVEELCQMFGLSESTFYQWKKEKVEFSEALKKAEEKRLEVFRKAARSGLLTLLQGKEWEEVTSEFKEVKTGKDDKGNDLFKPKMIYQKKVKKFLLPNATAVIFTLKNTDGEYFKDLLRQEHSGPNGKPIETETKHTVVFKKYGQGDQS